jgi:hypothetical protein
VDNSVHEMWKTKTPPLPLWNPRSGSTHEVFGSHAEEHGGRGNLAAAGIEAMRSGSQDVALALRDLFGENMGAVSNGAVVTGCESWSEEDSACGVRRLGS